ncbi:MAG: mechanosensitive ion channel family protein [Candidatus Rokuibacteriota bacterium]
MTSPSVQCRPASRWIEGARGGFRLVVVAVVTALLSGALAVTAPMLAADTPPAEQSPTRSAEPEAELPSAPVMLDGEVLFRVRGTSSFPPERRAAVIESRIKALAGDRAVAAEAVRAVQGELGDTIVADGHRIMVVQDADARWESLERRALAEAVVSAIRTAVTDYRRARSREVLLGGAARAVVATIGLTGLVALVIWLSRRAQRALEKTYRQRVQSVGIQSFEIVRAEQIWALLPRVLAGVRAIVIIGLGFVFLAYVLGLFPWTRGVSRRLLQYVLDPLGTMGWGVVNALPDVVFLVILFLVTRAVLKVIYLFFAAVGRGDVALSSFEREWADPTYKLLRVAVVALALVVAYPYIPGSGSDAFKGISIFIGIIFSLGSSSAIANTIAGYSMTYRRAFKLGDRVKIGNTTGDVTEVRLQVTHVRTVKNEEVIIPNSSILNHEVVNYSTLARRLGLILHTRVGIGYETPWRQVEAMLLIAATRTPGLLAAPAPFVHQLTLGDFAVTYEINGYCDHAQAMGEIYTALHRSILDVFNEHGVQIMTPAYEGDPETPKIVPKDQWHAEPARTVAAPEARNP